jgi:HAE1 family hydrophobic/amphiphilic exporter-1
MFSKFFINRPIFAAVISIVIVIAGAVTLLNLPVAQYPNIAPPTVQVMANYPGANADVVAKTVAAPIEQEVNGVDGMIYMSSNSASNGSYVLTVTFDTGTDLDMATVLVQNRVAVALSSLPEEVKRLGVTTKKTSPDFALMINLLSTDGKMDDVYLSNYATLHIRDVLSRVDGVGDVQVLGADAYSMRVWLDPEAMDARGLTTSDVVAAISEQNVQVAAGTIGKPPAPKGQSFQYTVNVKGRLTDPAEFGNIVVKTGEGGRLTRVRDVAKVELGAKSYDVEVQLNQKPASLIIVNQRPGANVLAVSKKCRAAMEDLKKRFPQGLEYVVAYDASDVVNASIKEIVETLFIAALLVVLTVYIFLQDIRSTFIPAVTIPVSLIGTFLIMNVLGFSINTLTLFGMVLAIGIVVDDAIVVVENAARNIEETDLSPKEATIKAMEEVTGPVIATTLVLLAVFIPTAFMGGMTGVLYKQFALTIAATTLFSSINALTLSPALCALILRRAPKKKNFFFRGFNRGFETATTIYMAMVNQGVRRLFISVLVFAGVSAAAYLGMISTPTAFVPEEDQGYMMVNTQLPDGASQQRTSGAIQKVNKVIADTPGIAYNIAISGYSLLNSTVSSNMGSNVVVFKPWDERTTLETNQYSILGGLRKGFSAIQEGIVFAFLTPALPGLGNAGGFQMQLQDQGGQGLNQLQQVADEIVRDGSSQKGLVGMYSSFRSNVPQLFVEVDRNKVKTLNIPLSEVFDTMQAFLGSAYVNDFNLFGRTYQVNVQAESKYRAQPEDIRKLEVRTNEGKMVPLGTLVQVKNNFGAEVISRYNMYNTAAIMGSAAPGYSSGQALEIMENMAQEKLPSTMGFEWTGLSYQETQATGDTGLIFLLAVVFVYLVLAAQYESWKSPMPVILAVPIAVFGAFAAIIARGMDNNVYTQIGLVLLVALASKNAILIVEFARDAHEQGMSTIDAALHASRLRFRPILMTALSFVLGVFPLVVADGAGAGARQALGTAVLGGMLAATFVGVVLVPPLYVIFQNLGEKRKEKAKAKEA